MIYQPRVLENIIRVSLQADAQLSSLARLATSATIKLQASVLYVGKMKHHYQSDKTDLTSMKIDTGSHPPIKMREYKTTLNKMKIVEEAVDELLEAGIIERSHRKK